MQKEFTVGDLRAMLAHVDSNTKLSIAGGLTIARIKRVGREELFMEFAEIEADLSHQFRTKFPNVKVAFCSFEPSGNLADVVYVPRL